MTAPQGWARPGPAGPPMAPGPPPSFRPDPPRAGPAAIAAVFVALALSWTIFGTTAGGQASLYAVVAFVSTAIGAALALTTPVARTFRTVTAVVAAILVGIGTLIMFGAIGLIGTATLSLVWCAVFITAGLDLCWVPRLRTMLFLSGLCMAPVLVARPATALMWVVAWFIVFLVAQWLLTADAAAALARPETAAPIDPRPVRNGGDLARILGVTLLAGTTLALLFSAPACSPQWLADWFPNLPFRPSTPTVDRGTPVWDYEIDANDHEVRFDLDGKGRRYVQFGGMRSAVIQASEGVDRFVTEEGEVHSVLTDGASTLRVLGSRGPDRVFRRDDRGWYIDAGDDRYRLDLTRRGTVLVAPDGTEVIGRSRGGDVELTGSSFDPLVGDGSRWFAIPPGEVLAGTAAADSTVVRGRTLTVRDARSTRRYRRDGAELVVDVERRYTGAEEYRWRADRSGFDVSSDGRSLGTVEVDRTGNAFDGETTEAPDHDQPPEPPSIADGLRRAAIIAVVLLVIVGAVLLYLRLRKPKSEDDTIEDRLWAEDELRRLEQLGRAHGHRRGVDRSVVSYTELLRREVDDGDPRFTEVGEVLDAAFYGRRPLSGEERLRTTAIIDRLVEDHPRPDRSDRNRDRHAGSAR